MGTTTIITIIILILYAHHKEGEHSSNFTTTKMFSKNIKELHKLPWDLQSQQEIVPATPLPLKVPITIALASCQACNGIYNPALLNPSSCNMLLSMGQVHVLTTPVVPQPFLGHPRMYRDTWGNPGMSLVRVTDYTSWIPVRSLRSLDGAMGIDRAITLKG